jgi:hypothetical protein
MRNHLMEQTTIVKILWIVSNSKIRDTLELVNDSVGLV